MQHPFAVLAADYARLDARAVIVPSREHEVAEVAERLLRDKQVYAEVSEKSRVPTAWLMAISEREMSGNLHCYLGNGQPLNRRTTIVPRNRGPFPDFVAGALDAMHLEGLDKVADQPGGWSMERYCYESELWNGFGYRARGIPSPYVYGGTTVQRRGKFVADGAFDPSVMDPQLGTLAIAAGLIKLDPSLAFAPVAEKEPSSDEPVAVAPPPAGLAGNVRWLQLSLNRIHAAGTPIAIDGSYGRITRRAVMAFQRSQGLAADGLAGPKTLARVQYALQLI